MSFIIYDRLGSCERDPPTAIFERLLDELDEAPEDEEHFSVSVVHESEWGLGCQRGGYVNYEHVEGDGEPRHMTGLSREKVLELMRRIAAGELTRLEEEPWKAGY